MDDVFVGKIVNTHGIKGEIRIVSDFEFKEKVFIVGNEIIINNNNYKIASYRVHKNFDMITLEGLNDINLVIPFKGLNVFIKRDILNLPNNQYLLEDLINAQICLNDEIIGTVEDYNQGSNPLLHIAYENSKYYIPLKGNFIKNIDVENKIIEVNDEVKGLIL